MDIDFSALFVTIVVLGGKGGIVDHIQITFTAMITDNKGISGNFITGTCTTAANCQVGIVNSQSTFTALTENNNAVGAAAESDFSTVFDDHFGVVGITGAADLDFAGKFGIVDDDLAHDVHGADLVFAGGVGDGESTVAADAHIGSLEDLVSHNGSGEITEEHIVFAHLTVVITDDHLTAHIDVGVGSEIDAAGIFSIVPVTNISVRCFYP